MAYATASDVTVRWGKAADALAPEIISLINVRLDDAERLIKKRIPDLDTVDPDDLVQVEADAVLRLAKNPDGYLSETDGNYTYMLQNDLTTGRLEIQPEEWEILGVSSNGLFVIAPNVVRAT